MSIVNDFYAPGDAERTAIVVNLIRDHVKTMRDLHVLDLACRTGVISQAVAATGATVTGIEGKPGNYDRIQHTPGTKFYLDDVRNLSVAKYGTFDVTLCLGLLYHLEAADAIRLLTAMRAVTKRFAIIDTHISTRLGEAIDIVDTHVSTTVAQEDEADFVTVSGTVYSGHTFVETPPSLWSSLGNSEAWWFTTASLVTACNSAGWDAVQLRDDVTWSQQSKDRRWLLLW